MSKAEFSIEEFPKIRRATIGVLKAAKRKNIVHSIIEVDISAARKKLRNLKKSSNNYISFTGYIIYCVSKAVNLDKRMHAYRNIKNQLVLFNDVDVSTTMERRIDKNNEVVGFIIRGANNKSLTEISREIDEEASRNVKKAEVYGLIHLFLAIPGFLRQIVFTIMDKSPQLMKKRVGTIMVTSVNLFSRGAGWGIPIATHTLNVTIGGIVERILEKNSFEKREHLCLTLSFDHDIIDGAPAARFIKNLKRIIENGDI